MLSYDIVEHGKPLQKALRETPKPQGTEVLVRVLRSGVCHTDLHLWDGYFDLGGGRRYYIKDRGQVPPITLGHEPYGAVEALGPQAASAEPGAAVGAKGIVYPWIGCGACAVCRAGQDNYCLAPRFIGAGKPGAYATHILVPHPKYLIAAEGLDPSFAATLACSGLTAYSAAKKLQPFAAEDWVAVIGCGGLGLMDIAILAAMGAKNIVACDLDPAKLEAAKRLGARAVVDTRAADAAKQVQKLSGGGVAGSIDFVGLGATSSLGVAALRKGGRHIVVGLMGGELSLGLVAVAQRAISVTGNYVGTLQELKEVVALARAGRLPASPVETRPAVEINRTLEELKAGKILGRAVLDFETAGA
jgi:D-arabinose 1-dehydrogenase-like Zn-dependent alcohol dehydrogenase